MSLSIVTLAASNVTAAWPLSRLTSAVFTPSSFVSDFFTPAAHLSHVMPLTLSVTLPSVAPVVGQHGSPACASGTHNRLPRVNAISIFFMVFPLGLWVQL